MNEFNSAYIQSISHFRMIVCALTILCPCNFLNHLELKQDSERQIHSQISKFCKLSFDRSFLGRTCRVWWNCLSVIGLMPKLPPSSILRGPPTAQTLLYGRVPIQVPSPHHQHGFQQKWTIPVLFCPTWLQEHIVLGMMGLH